MLSEVAGLTLPCVLLPTAKILSSDADIWSSDAEVLSSSAAEKLNSVTEISRSGPEISSFGADLLINAAEKYSSGVMMCSYAAEAQSSAADT